MANLNDDSNTQNGMGGGGRAIPILALGAAVFVALWFATQGEIGQMILTILALQ